MQAQKEILNSLSDFAYMVIAPGVPFPLNLPPEVLLDPERAEEVQTRLNWPIPFHQASDPWPCSVLDFYPNAGNPWAASPLEGSLPLLIFLDHLYSFIMGRIRTTCRDIIVTNAALEDSLREALKSAVDQEIITIDGDLAEINRMINILDFKEVNGDYWKIVQAIERAFERASGMDPLLYGGGSGTQMRSAREADIREGHVTSRPNDFADMVEDWNSRIAHKEAIATRLLVPPPYQLFGEEPIGTEDGLDYSNSPLSLAWASLVNTEDPGEAASHMRYTVEAGSGRRKNRQAMIADANNLSNTLLPSLQAYASATGDTAPFNAMLDILAETYEQPLNRLHLKPIPLPAAPNSGVTPPQV
jgi:hypothetical protein